jgi:hypothetical protein
MMAPNCGLDKATEILYHWIEVPELKRTKVPELLAIYKAHWSGYRWNSPAWAPAFGGTKLPVTEEQITIVDDSGTISVDLHLLPITKGKFHRVMVTCPRCGKEIPAGRIHQHTC